MSPRTSRKNFENNFNGVGITSEVAAETATTTTVGIPDIIAESVTASAVTANGAANTILSRGVPTASLAKAPKFMSYNNMLTLLALLLYGSSFISSVDGLKCHMCGQYNEGVGSITPCLNYSDQYAHLYLKECPKKSEKFCVKYVSELSTVRDCATECVEKEIWETQTYCCNQDGCNGSNVMKASVLLLMIPLLYGAYVLLHLPILKVRR